MSSVPTDAREVPEIGWNFEHTYERLPAEFYFAARPAPVREPRVAALNLALGRELGLDLSALSAADAADIFSGRRLPAVARPLAQAYAGHQFGGFTMLGDGRALLWGEQRTPAGRLVDLQFKGSGPTPYSRRGDGLAALGPMLREYVISEAMQALGIPTTRSLAVVATGERVYRETPLPGAILTRVATSHLRVGTFQYAAARRHEPHLRALADYAIARHYAHFESLEGAEKYLAFLDAVIRRQAALVARWQFVGFVHGVMNTDNMTISGETIDYGPCAFLDAYHTDTVFSSIDSGGRYAFGAQPGVAQWNLARFAESLLSLIDENSDRAVERAVELIRQYPAIFQREWLTGMRRKLGLETEEPDDPELITGLLDWMQTTQADFTNTFDDLSRMAGAESEGESLTSDKYHDPAFQAWHARWLNRVAREPVDRPALQARMHAVNPAVIPRNHRVEEALAAAVHGDMTVLERLVSILATPFKRSDDAAAYRSPPPAGSCGYRTFCGT